MRHEPHSDILALPGASVLVKASGREAEPALLVRAIRVAGLAADRAGGVGRVHVTLSRGSERPEASRSGNSARITMGAGLASRLDPGEVLGLIVGALARATSGRREPRRARARRPGRGGAHVVLLENPFVDPDRPAGEVPRSMACGTFQLASALRRDGVGVGIVPGRLDPRKGFTDMRALGTALRRGGTMIGLTLLESCFEHQLILARRIRSMSDALVAVGGPMATMAPLHVAAHMAGPILVVRGGGEAVLPGLARLLSGGADDEAAEAILGMGGVLLLGRDLAVAGHLGRVNDPDPDETPMDFSLLGPEHLGGGLSLETARGCTNPCVFCTTPGRDSHRGRSPEVVASHLEAYSARLEEIYGRHQPAPARRVHICDDDFTCDPARAAGVLDEFGRSGLFLAAFQASIRDLVDGRDAEGCPRLRLGLLDAIRPSLFQDAARGRALAGRPRGRIPDRMGSFVHLGVEAFDDADLARLGKGYRAADASAVVDALDERGIVHDAYLILSGPGTTLDDLATSLLEVARLKMEHPATFFVRVPVVPFVVPTFPSAAWKVWSRRIASGSLDGSIELHGILRIHGFPDLDYPLVGRGLPGDPDVRDACEAWDDILETDPLLVRPVENLEAFLRRRLPGIEDPGRAARIRRTVRRLSGARSRLAYAGVAMARRGKLPDRVSAAYWSAVESLGNPEAVAREARNLMDVGDPRLVVIPTRDCSLRCGYCPMDKEPGKLMSGQTLDMAVELLLSSSSSDLILQFFGGEALLCRDLVLAGMDRALGMARSAGKNIGFILSTNGLSLDRDLLARIARLPVKVEVSVDGTPGVHNRHRRPRDRGVDSYASATRFASALSRSGIQSEVIMVVTPSTVDCLAESFAHVATLGFGRMQVNHALSVMWSRRHKEAFARELRAIEERFFQGGPGASGIEWVDLRMFTRPMLLNGELTVDHDGTIYHGNGFLVRTATPAEFRAGHLDDLENMDSYIAGKPDNDWLIAHTYPADVAANNMEVARIYGSFIAHMRRRFPAELGHREPTRRPVPACPERS